MRPCSDFSSFLRSKHEIAIMSSNGKITECYCKLGIIKEQHVCSIAALSLSPINALCLQDTSLKKL